MGNTPKSRHLVFQRHKTHTHNMLTWISSLAFLAVALAAPQITTVQPLNSQFISSTPAPRILSSQPLVGNVQTVGVQSLGVQALPVGNIQSYPYQTNLQSYPVQTVQNLPVQTVHSLPVQSVQSLPIQSVQSLPVQTLQVQNVRPINLVRSQPIYNTATVRPVIRTQVQAQPILRAQPIVRTQPIVHQIQSQPQIIQTQPIVHQIQSQPQIIHSQPIVQTQPIVHHAVTPVTVQVPQQRLAIQQQAGVAILRQVQDVQADGSYNYAFETENGIRAQEEGRINNQGTDVESSAVSGSYSYTAPDGTPITVNYIADENGFRAEGEHIPKPSEEILRSLEYLRSLPPRPEDESGKYVRDSNGY